MICEKKLPSQLRQLSLLTPDAIEQRLGRLIRHYLQSRSPAIALSVVRHIECLCAHPGFEGDSAQRCVYLRMCTHWRWLAKRNMSKQETRLHG